MPIERLSLSAMERLVQSRHGRNILNELSKRHPFIEALESDIGQELLNDLLVIISEKAAMVIEETASETDRATYRAAKALAERWGERVATYERLQGEAKTHVMKG